MQTSMNTILTFSRMSGTKDTVTSFGGRESKNRRIRSNMQKLLESSKDKMQASCEDTAAMQSLHAKLLSSLTDSSAMSLKRRTSGVASILGAYKALNQIDGKCSSAKGLVGRVTSGIVDVYNYVAGSNSSNTTDRSLTERAAVAVISAKKNSMTCVMEKAVCPAVKRALYERLVRRMSKRNGVKKYKDYEFTTVDDSLIIYMMEFLASPDLPAACRDMLYDDAGHWHGRGVCKSGRCKDDESPKPVLLGCAPCSRELLRCGLYPDGKKDRNARRAYLIQSYARRSRLPFGFAAKVFSEAFLVQAEWWHISNVLWLATVPEALANGNGTAVILPLVTATWSLVQLAQNAHKAQLGALCLRQAAVVLNAGMEDPKSLDDINAEAGEPRSARLTEEEKQLQAKEGLAREAVTELKEIMDTLEPVSLDLESKRKLAGTWDELRATVEGASAAIKEEYGIDSESDSDAIDRAQDDGEIDEDGEVWFDANEGDEDIDDF
jgi:hypothetical protein